MWPASPLNRDGSARHVDVNSRSRELEVRYPPRAIEPKHRDQRTVHRVARKSFETLARQSISQANHDLAGRGGVLHPRHQRRQQESLGILEVFVEDAAHVFRRELHRGKYIESESRDGPMRRGGPIIPG